MSAPEASIPYEKQSDPQNNRTCGAACLSMVYRSLGKEVQQSEIWPAIAKQNRFGSLASTTHLMAQDALNRGFAAVAIQARYPLQVLRLARDGGIRAILNLRLQSSGPAGHYAVLVGLDDRNVVLHDPFFGPSRSLPHAELLELWLPYFANSEIVGNVLIAVAPEGELPETACEFCRTPMPPSVECPRCGKAVGLQPRAVLGCFNDACIARMWSNICCPFCDHMWTFRQAEGSASTRAGAAPASDTRSDEDQVDLSDLFGELDKFCNLVLSMPAAASHPDIKHHMETLATRREQLKVLQADALTHLKVHRGQLASLVQAAKEKEEAHRNRMEQINTPAPPLDGDALGRALLKNLGFTG